VILCTCCVAGDWSAGGDAESVIPSTELTADESEEPGLRSWPPKSHTGGAAAAVPGTTECHLPIFDS